MYRDGSGPYYDKNVRVDTRGYPRDHFPNAGAAEIYWTKFDPGVAHTGKWTDKSMLSKPPLNGIQSLLNDEIYYLITTPGGKLTAFPRAAIDTTDADFGFVGWESNQPSNPTAAPVDQIFPMVQPSIEVVSTKQTYTAAWVKERFRVDFDLNYDGLWGTPQIRIPKGSLAAIPETPMRGNHDFDGWYTAGVGGAAWDFMAGRITEDRVLYARWARLYQIKVNASPADSGTVAASVAQTRAGAMVSLSARAYSGYEFVGWRTEKGGVVPPIAGAFSFAMPASDVELTALFKVVEQIVDPKPDPPAPDVPGPNVPGPVTPAKPKPPASKPASPDPPPGAVPKEETNEDAGAKVKTPDQKSAPEPKKPRLSEDDILRRALDRQSGDLLKDLFDGDIPAGNFGFRDAWSLLNLLMALIALICSAILILARVLRRRREEDDVPETTGRPRRLLGAAIAAGFIPAILFLLLEDLQLPATWVNRFTPLIGIFFLISIALHIIRGILKNRRSGMQESE
jgi:uncharacterized repeat protein (TIGR02543 family)